MIAVFDYRARQDLEAAVDWWEQQQAGLGAEFLNQALHLIESVKSNPQQFTPSPGTRHQEQLRVGLISKFHYLLVFKVEPAQERILVISIQHGSRRPGEWRRRLGSFSPEET
jgi:toxin ParE1/3/4